MKLSSLLAKLDPSQGPNDSGAASQTERPRSVVEPSGFLALIEMMRESGHYDFADETLRGIYDSVEKSKCVTEGQHQAVLNIRHSRKHEEDY